MRSRIITVLLILCFFSIFGSNEYVKSNVSKVQQLTYCHQRYDKELLLKAQTILESMSLKEKVGQMFITKLEALDTSFSLAQINNDNEKGITDFQTSNLSLEKYPVGGIVLFNKNLVSQTQLTHLINEVNSLSQYPLFIAVDEEGGVISRIANSGFFGVENYGPNESIGKTNDFKYANEVATHIATYLNDLGINVNFAPVADINSNVNHPVIGNRSFGHDPFLVSSMVNAQIQGFHTQDIIAVTKHYPGHGDTSSDTHLGLVTLNKTLTDIKTLELIPFLKSMHQTDMIMVSHITLPLITNIDLPTSLSKEIIQNQLREQFHYEGVVITDALNMKAITQYYSSKEAVTYGLNAGVDIFLMPYDLQEAFDSLYELALVNESRIDESVLRILYLKLKYNIILD